MFNFKLDTAWGPSEKLKGRGRGWGVLVSPCLFLVNQMNATCTFWKMVLKDLLMLLFQLFPAYFCQNNYSGLLFPNYDKI